MYPVAPVTRICTGSGYGCPRPGLSGSRPAMELLLLSNSAALRALATPGPLRPALLLAGRGHALLEGGHEVDHGRPLLGLLDGDLLALGLGVDDLAHAGPVPVPERR